MDIGKKLAAFTRSLFNATFKGNPYLERAIMTGITLVSRESIFSDYEQSGNYNNHFQ